MTTPIRDTLAVLADEMPPVRIPDDVWRRGRRRRRVRWAATGAGVAAIVLLIVMLPVWRTGHEGSVQRHAGSGPAVPGRLYIPWLWQATVDQSAPGRAAVTFTTDQTIYLEPTGVVVGQDGAYRIVPIDVGEEIGPLSPDGRYQVRAGGGRLVDLETGEERGFPHGTIIAWSRDSRQVLTIKRNDDAVISYGSDGRPLNDPRKPDDIDVVDVATGAERRLRTEHVEAGPAGAFAPDATRIAVTVGESYEEPTLKVLDAADGTVRWTASLGRNRQLAGSGAWSPDGQRIALFAFAGCAELTCDEAAQAARRWRIEFLDARTGTDIPGSAIPLPGQPTSMLGWRRGSDPVFTLYAGVATYSGHGRLVALRRDGRFDVLVDQPRQVHQIEVPLDLLEQDRFGGPASRPNPLAVRRELLPCPLLGLASLALFIAWGRRRTRPARRQTAPADGAGGV